MHELCRRNLLDDKCSDKLEYVCLMPRCDLLCQRRHRVLCLHCRVVLCDVGIKRNILLRGLLFGRFSDRMHGLHRWKVCLGLWSHSLH